MKFFPSVSEYTEIQSPSSSILLTFLIFIKYDIKVKVKNAEVCLLAGKDLRTGDNV